MIIVITIIITMIIRTMIRITIKQPIIIIYIYSLNSLSWGVLPLTCSSNALRTTYPRGRSEKSYIDNRNSNNNNDDAPDDDMNHNGDTSSTVGLQVIYMLN